MLADAIEPRPSTLRIVLVLLLSAATVGAIAIPASAQGGSATEIDACTTISDPGRYVLTEDITDSDAGTCLDVRADDVVIDGNGHTIDGQSGSEGDGVGVRSQSNVVVRDLVVAEWDVGINYSQVTGGEVRNVVAERNTAGIELAAGSENTIVDNTVRDTGNGIYLHAIGETTSDRNVIRNNEVTNTSLAITFIGADNNTVTANTLRQSGVYGLSLLFSPTGNDYNEFRNNVVIDSVEDGVCLLRSRHNTFENTYVENSGRYDVYAVNGSTDNRMTNLTLTSATISTELRDVSLVAVDDPPTPAPAAASNTSANASAVGYVNATDTSPGTDPDDAYLAVEAPNANGSSNASSSVPVYQQTSDGWIAIGENGTNGAGTNVTDLGESETHQLLAFVGEGFASTTPSASTGGSAAENGTEAGTGTTGTGTQTEAGAGTDTGAETSTAGTAGSGATDTASGTDGGGTTATGGESATETSGPGFGLVIAALAVLGASLLAARRD